MTITKLTDHKFLLIGMIASLISSPLRYSDPAVAKIVPRAWFEITTELVHDFHDRIFLCTIFVANDFCRDFEPGPIVPIISAPAIK